MGVPSDEDVGARLRGFVRDIECVVSVYDTDTDAVGFQNGSPRQGVTYARGVCVSVHCVQVGFRVECFEDFERCYIARVDDSVGFVELVEQRRREVIGRPSVGVGGDENAHTRDAGRAFTKVTVTDSRSTV